MAFFNTRYNGCLITLLNDNIDFHIDDSSDPLEQYSRISPSVIPMYPASSSNSRVLEFAYYFTDTYPPITYLGRKILKVQGIVYFNSQKGDNMYITNTNFIEEYKKSHIVDSLWDIPDNSHIHFIIIIELQSNNEI